MTKLYVVVAVSDDAFAPDVMVFDRNDKAEQAMKECLEEYPKGRVFVQAVTLNKWMCKGKQ
ncbi:hypothetical protein [Mesorhizobium sp. DCY119]|uniref:hypothetical protein n=1 Tax=Mesorhizobium sp. DCY119 TaxID=2108445 RepID=UPI000E6D01D1|nr:hypothetical protein [Mesorhizobium sp. DCY119]RJG45863.1 hypothetical protein D3Y55_17470 [Mesorhizobium sp. DCY119]